MNVTRLLAPNPGSYTGPGTNTYVIASRGEAMVIDPGPMIDSHLAAIRRALVERPVAVLVTHAHEDHAALAGTLGDALGVPTYGHAPGGDFHPDIRLVDGEAVPAGEAEAVAVHTPGHSDDHLCFLVGGSLFSGDHVMGGSTVFVEDMVAYLDSLRRVLALAPQRIYPGHGAEIDRPLEVVEQYLRHRMDRERQILEAVTGGASTVEEIVEQVYREVDQDLHPLAARSVLAHISKLEAEGRLVVDRRPDSLWAFSVSTPGE